MKQNSSSKMIKMSKVSIARLKNNYHEAVTKVFNSFGGIKEIFPKGNKGKLFIKINAVSHQTYSNTSPEILAALLDLYIEAGLDPSRIYVIESCTSGLYTRITMFFTGLTKVIQERGVNIVYMDEEPVALFKIGKEKYDAEFAKIVVDNIINESERKNNILIHIPKFKAHWATKITMGIKLSLGYMFDSSKKIRHDWYHEERLVDLLETVKPDFCLVDADIAMARGPVASEKYLHDPEDPYIYNYDLVFGGKDTIAVDAIGAKLLGFKNLEVGTTKIAHERGLGIGDVKRIEVDFDGNVDSLIQNVPYDFRANYFPEKCLPPNYMKLVGENKYGKNVLTHCRCGCIGLSLISLELLWQDSSHLAKNDVFTVIFGKGFTDNELENLKIPILLLGSCAAELEDKLKRKYIDVKVYDSCGNLNDFYSSFLDVMQIDPLATVDFNQGEIMYNMLLAELNGVNAYTPLNLALKDIISVFNMGISKVADELFLTDEFENAIKLMIQHEKMGVRAEFQKFLGNLIKIKKLNNYIPYLESGLKDEKNKVVKNSLKAIEKLINPKISGIDQLKQEIDDLTKHKNSDIRKIARNIMENM